MGLGAAADLVVLQSQLDRWVVAHYDATATVGDLRTMPGHAGLSFGFDVIHHDQVLDPLVLRMPPRGVRRSGNTDVLRQVPLLKALWEAGVPVAEVRWWDDDERWFEVPYIMVALLPGDTFRIREVVAAASDLGAEDPHALVRPHAARAMRHAVEALAKVHRVPWRDVLGEWEQPKLLADEVRFWDRLLDKVAESEWVPMGRDVRDRLLETLPADPVVGVFHGDFQTNNLLYDAGELVAVLDWEISGIGAQLLDLGWLLMMNDPESWADGQDLAVVPPFAQLVEWYAAAVGRSVSLADVAWYRALAGYRFGVISCFNVMLHRTGKRPDPEWDRIAPSVPRLFGRAGELLDEAAFVPDRADSSPG